MTDLSEVHWYSKIFRYLFAMLDKIIYGLVAFVMEVFYLVAGAEIRFGDTVTSFFNRIQLILGVIILFKLVISLLSGIVNPDGLKDEKKGVGNIIKRVIVVLVMILMIVPLNIPEGDVVDLSENADKNSQKTWNSRMNESGILFGTMSELQSRILNGNVIPKLVLGTGSADTNEDISLILLKNFIFVNLKAGAEDATNEDNWVCPKKEFENGDDDKTAEFIIDVLNGTDQEAIDKVIKEASQIFGKSPTKKSINETTRELILEGVNYKCDKEHFWFVDLPGGERYIFVYKFFLSTIAGVLCFFLILSLTFDVATRVFKLVILRLISPVAILSYIDSKTEKTFNNWVKAVGTTYADLFIRLTIISFVLLLITLIPKVEFNVYAGDASAMAKLFARVILYLGLLFFAREAPKFITETLGIDSKEGKGLFSGLGKAAATVVGGITTARMGYKASLEASKHNDPDSKDSTKNRAKAIMAGLASGASTAAGTAGSYDESKDHKWRTAMDKVSKANAYRMQNAAEGGSWWGKVKSQAYQDFTGDSRYAQLKREEKDLKDKQQGIKNQQDKVNAANNLVNKRLDYIQKLRDYGESQALKKGAHIKDVTGATVDYAKWMASFETAKATGKDLEYTDISGNKLTMTLENAYDIINKGTYKELAEIEYIKNSDKYNKGDIDQGVVNKMREAGYDINTVVNISNDEFNNNLKNDRNDLLHQNTDNTIQINKLQEQINDYTDKLTEKAKEIATAQADYRGDDGKHGGT